MWNKPSVGKLVWWVKEKADHLWIKWVDHVYLEGKEWATYVPGINTSWAYNITEGYGWLRDKGPVVQWHKIVWNRYNMPKATFVGWLSMHNRLMTRESRVEIDWPGLGFALMWSVAYVLRLMKVGRDHLFFECKYSQMCTYLMEGWLGIIIGSCQQWDQMLTAYS
ncbi:hypothetical protein vseg_015462 [Gypsophila vaccaria]